MKHMVPELRNYSVFNKFIRTNNSVHQNYLRVLCTCFVNACYTKIDHLYDQLQKVLLVYISIWV